MGSILQSSIKGIPHLDAFDEMVEARFSAIDVEAVLIYLIDIVDSDALPLLAKQFDVLGYKGFDLTQTETEKREVIKKALKKEYYKKEIKKIEEKLGVRIFVW